MSLHLFYSYAADSRKDESFLSELEKHLSSLEREGLIKSWSPRRIQAGMVRKDEIARHLHSARVVLLLVSADFLATSECMEITTQALALHEARQAEVIPVLLRAVDWKSSPLGQLQPCPRSGKAIASWPDRDEAWLEVATSIREVVERLARPADPRPALVRPIDVRAPQPEAAAAPHRATPSISWLHLTDLHQGMGEQAWLWPNVREQFFKDLERLHKLSGPWDVVLFTGDLTNRGSPEEFAQLEKTLERIFKHLRGLGSEPRLLAVPGNHDLRRPSAKAAAVRVLRNWHEDAELRRDFWGDPDNESRQTVNTAFAPYVQWAQGRFGATTHTGLLPGDFSATIQKDGLRLGIVGLNSAFLQLTGDHYEGRLELDPRQLHAACGGDAPDWLSEQNATLLLTHHPVSWLHPDTQRRFHAEIYLPGRFVAHLFGHLHEPQAITQSVGGAQPRRQFQGASLFGLEDYQDRAGQSYRRSHGYCAGRIERGEGRQLRLRLFPRSLVQRMAGHAEMDRDPRYSLDEDGSFVEIHTPF